MTNSLFKLTKSVTWMLITLGLCACTHMPNSSLTTPVPDLEIVWHDRLAEGGRVDNVVFTDGFVFYAVYGEDNVQTEVAAYNLQTQRRQWEIAEQAAAPALFDNGLVFLLNEDNRELLALSATGGEEIWQIALPPLNGAGSRYELAAAAGLVFVGTGQEIHALNAENARVVWVHPLNGLLDPFKPDPSRPYEQRYGALAYYNEVLYVRMGRRGPTLVALNANDGQELWAFAFEIPVPSGDLPPTFAAPVAAGEEGVFLAPWRLHNPTVYLLDRETGEPVWQRNVHIRVPSAASPLLTGEQVVIDGFVEPGGDLIGLDISNGEVQWSVDSPNCWPVSPLRVEGNLVFVVIGACYDNEPNSLMAIDLESGETRATLSLSGRGIVALWSEPGTVYPISGSEVYAIAVSPGNR